MKDGFLQTSFVIRARISPKVALLPGDGATKETGTAQRIAAAIPQDSAATRTLMTRQPDIPQMFFRAQQVVANVTAALINVLAD